MNLSSIPIPKLNLPWQRKQDGPKRSGGPIAVVHWDREKIHYLVVSPKSKRLKANDIGSVAHADLANPFIALSNHFKQTGLQVKQLVVLLSRPELDQLNLSLPPSELSELPMLVASEVEQQLGENEEAATVDYYVLPSLGSSDENASNSTQQVMAFALSAKVERTLLAQVEEAGFKATAIGSRHLSPLGILRRRHVPDNTLAVSIHLYAGEAELAFCLGAAPLLLRSIRIIAEEPERIAEQIWLESQRCLALLPNEVAELPFSWFVFTSCEVAWPVAQALEDHDQIVVQPVDPLIGWETDAPRQIRPQH